MTNNPVPLEIIDLLNDDEETGDEDMGDEEVGLVEEEEDDGALDIGKMPVFIKVEDACIEQIASPSGPEQPETESESEEDWEPYDPSLLSVQMLEPTDPLTSLARSPVAAISSSSTTRGLPSRFRTQRGRGRGRTQNLRIREPRGENRWTRGNRFEEVYRNDVDLPPNIREQTQRHPHVSNELEEAGDEDELDEYMMSEQFEWRGMDTWNGVKETFESELAGPTRSFNNAYDAFHAIWTDDIMTHIANETNKYAQATVLQRDRFARDWYETNFHEIWCLVAFWIMLGIIRMPSIKSCFTKIPLLKTDVFRYIFTETRYWNLNAAFHLNAINDPNDPLSPMGPVLDHLNTKFKELYRLDQEICIDESLTLWKGPVGLKQYIETKAARFGIKTYQLCESGTGYLWSFFVYVGRASGSGTVPSSVSSVLQLIRPLLHRGHTLYLDNWFNSPSLARWLKRRGTDCVGTLRPSRKHVPVAIKSCPLKEGQFVARASDDVMVLALQDRSRVTCISTFHDVSQVCKDTKGRSSQFKFQLIDDYNKAMGGVDRMDQMLEAYQVERKQCLKWNKKLFKRLLNITIQNSRILLEKRTGTKIDSLAFRLSLVQEILNQHLEHVPRKVKPASSRNPTFPLQRLTERHFIRRIRITEEMRQNISHRTNLGRRVCVWCTHNGRKRSRTVYECVQCELPLCLEPCFQEFHVIPCASNGETVFGS